MPTGEHDDVGGQHDEHQNMPTPVYEAAQNGHTEELKMLIRHNPAVLSMSNDANFFDPVLAAAEGTPCGTPEHAAP